MRPRRRPQPARPPSHRAPEATNQRSHGSGNRKDGYGGPSVQRERSGLMSQRAWFRRRQNGDGFDEEQEHHDGRQGSGRLSRLNRLWRRQSLAERQWRAEERSVRYQTDPLSHGLL
jgi:hypothetical protein